MKKIYILALFFAILTGISVYSFVSHLQSAAQVKKDTVVVAVARIPENTLITEDMVAVKKIPEESVNPLAVHDIAQVKGRITNAAIEADEPILSARLNEQGTDKGGLAFTIPEGKRAMTVAVDDISGVAGYIQKSNHVDVVASLMLDVPAEDKTQKVAKTVLLLQNMEVLAINTKTVKKDSAGYTNITLAVTPEEAVKLFYAQTNGKLTVVLRPVLEKDVKNISPYAP